MMQLTHAATAAAAGTYIESPIIAFFIGVIIHLIIDKIPHYWPSEQNKKNKIIPVDYAITALFIALLAYYKIPTPAIYWSLAGSLVIDITLVGIKSLYKSPIGQWHTNRQIHMTKIYYLIIDGLLVVASLAILYLSYIN